MGVLENAPGPSPWYLRRGNPPPLVPGFKWEAAGETGQTAGAMVLAGPDGAVLILDFHNYVVLLDPGAEVRGRAHAGFLTQLLQLHRQRNQRLDIAPRPDCRQQHAHENSPLIRPW